MNSIKDFLNHPLYDYDKHKANLLKAIFPFLIIIHHLEQYNLPGIGIFDWVGRWVMYLFFAMSGYGLVISYIKKKEYINGFLGRSLPKLFIPYFVTFVLFAIYRYLNGIDQIELFKSVGLLSFIPTSWFIYILSLFYIFFYVVFRYSKKSIAVKVFLTSLLVMGYILIAFCFGVSFWRYDKCPAFVIGMFFALTNNWVRIKFARKHALFVLTVLLGMLLLPFGHRLDPFYYPSAVFLVMYIMRGCSFMESRIVVFLSSISLEMFIIQYLPIYIVLNHIVSDHTKYSSTLIIVSLVLVMDVVLAFVMHRFIYLIKSMKKGR